MAHNPRHSRRQARKLARRENREENRQSRRDSKESRIRARQEAKKQRIASREKARVTRIEGRNQRAEERSEMFRGLAQSGGDLLKNVVSQENLGEALISGGRTSDNNDSVNPKSLFTDDNGDVNWLNIGLIGGALNSDRLVILGTS